ALGAQPAHLHLLEEQLVLAQAPLAPPAPIGPNTPPPLVEPPPAPLSPPPVQGPDRVVQPTGPILVQPPPELHLVDPSKGSLAFGEVGAGAGTSLLFSGRSLFDGGVRGEE